MQRMQSLHEGETVIEYGWTPQWVSPPELTAEQISTLKRGKSVEGDFGLRTWDLFLLDSSVVVCYYADSSECWIRMMNDYETNYLKANNGGHTMKENMLVIDIETTGLDGLPKDRVLEIGIAELVPYSKEIRPVYQAVIHYPDIKEFVEENGPVWVFGNSSLSMEDVIDSEKSLEQVIREVREIVKGKEVTSYNTGFDFDRFLFREPWNLQEVCTVPADIMKLATDRVRELFEAGKIQDLVTREKLAAKWDERPDSWVSAFDSYMILCPGDIYDKVHPELHRALDDAMREAEILHSCLEAEKEE